MLWPSLQLRVYSSPQNASAVVQHQHLILVCNYNRSTSAVSNYYIFHCRDGKAHGAIKIEESDNPSQERKQISRQMELACVLLVLQRPRSICS